MVIIPAEKRHIPAMLRLLGQVGALHGQGRPELFRSDALKNDASQLEALLQDPGCPIFIAEEGEVLGYCFCQKQVVEGNRCVCGRKELYIDDLCVDEAARGRGIGRALYEFVRSWAKGEGFDHITLHVWNFPGSAVEFYRSLGMGERYYCMEEKL